MYFNYVQNGYYTSSSEFSNGGVGGLLLNVKTTIKATTVVQIDMYNNILNTYCS